MVGVGMFSAFCIIFGLWLSIGADLNAVYKQVARPCSLVMSCSAIAWRFRVLRTIRSRMIQLGNLLFSYRDYLFPGAFLLLAMTTKPTFPFGSERWDRWMDAFGFLVTLTGQGCRVLAIGSVQNIRRRGQKKRITATTLICTGFFAHSRNPLYLGNLLIFCGLVIMANSYWWYVLALPGFIGMYWAIILAEEEFLTKQFSHEYAEYCSRVNRFVPRILDLRRALKSTPFDWRRAVCKETRVVCSWATLAVGVLTWERVQQFGFAARRTEIELFLMALFTVYCTYGVVLWLKGNGMLR